MNIEKFPYAKRFLEQHPEFDIDQALLFVEQQLRKRKDTESETRRGISNAERDGNSFS